MKCTFINLASQPQRRANLEANLKRHAPTWDIRRLEAFGPADAEAQDNIRVIYSDPHSTHNPGGTGCYLSHMKALEMSLADEDPIVILEDDAAFGKQSAMKIENMVSSLPKDSWDVIFGSVTFTSIASIMEAIFRFRKALATEQILFASAADVHFASTTTYIVNGPAKKKLLECLGAYHVNYGFDITMREIFHTHQVRGLIPLPFLTSVSEHSAVGFGTLSGNIDCILNSFRKLLYAERDLAEIRRDLASTGSFFADDESDIFGSIMAALVSPHFTGK